MASASNHKKHLANYLNNHKQRSFETSSSASSNSKTSAVPKKKTEHHSKSSTSNQSSRKDVGNRHCLNHRRPPPLIRGKATIDYLPCEILLEIFSLLEAQDLLKAACVCKLWHELANDNQLWEKIFQTHAAVPGRDTGPVSQPQRPPLAYWKSLCIKRCTEKRNKTCLKLLKKIHPYTGLPKFTEKALRSAGVSFQLCLIDSDSNEHSNLTNDMFHHSMSVAVRWHSLTTVPIARVKRIQVYSCNPLFFDKKGQAVKSGPYQRSLMTSVDLRWSSYVRDNTPIAGDDTVALYSVPGADILVATWKADGELAFVVTGYHHHHLVMRCLLGSTASGYELPDHKPVADDIDPSYGLHHYKCNVDVRNVRTSLWSQQFHNLHCRKQDIGDGYASFSLIRRDCPTDHVIIPKKLTLLWKTELFKGVVKNVAWLDVTLLDERDDVFWALSSPLTAKEKEKSKSFDFDYNGETHLTASFTGEKGQVHLELSQMDDDRTFVSHLEVKVAIAAINEWFQTCY